MKPSRILALLLSGVGLAAAAACVDRETHETAGEVLYRRHCASCHGMEGRGDGPLASTLKTPPSDLTLLAARAGGRFDEAAVMQVIDGRRLVAQHGPRDMPVWGAVFEEKHRDEPLGVYGPFLDARSLADYLRRIQRPGAPAEE